MAKVSLRIYSREIENLIERSQLDEAIAHCRHILKTFPKHLETYRLLGKAYLEAKRYTEAVNIFQRVLMAVPDDFVSHVGMSIIRDDENKLDEAIWHMERAFEVQPSNSAIQGELQRLFGRRDGVEPPKIRLTRGALAHMYMQGELYAQAISEIRTVLSNDPQRADIQVLLARAFFHSGQKVEASDMCSQLLKKYPYCLDANRILVEVLPGTNQAESVQVYRQRVNELDPYAAFTRESVFHSEEVADAAVNLERLEYSGQSVDMQPEWGASLGIGLGAVTSAAAPAGEPEWLKSGPGETAPETPAPAPESGSEIPDFLRQAGWAESSGEFKEGPSPFASEPESGPAPAPELAQGDLPDWVKAMAPPEGQGDESTAPPAAAPSDAPDWLKSLGADQPAQSTPAPEPAPSADIPDWLEALDADRPIRSVPAPATSVEGADRLNIPGEAQPQEPLPEAQESPPPQAAGPAVSAGDVSEWLHGLDQEQPPQAAPVQAPSEPAPAGPSASVEQLGATAEEQDDAVAWLESLAAKHGAKAEELVTDPSARSETPPDWVKQAQAIGEQTPAPPPLAADEDKTGMWLRELAEQETFDQVSASEEKQEETPLFSEQEAPDWLSGLGASESQPAEPAAEPAAEGKADWLKRLESESEQSAEPGKPAEEPAPDWIGGPESSQEQSVSAGEAAPAEQVSFETESSENLPDWLAGLEKEQTPASGAASSDELPSWLQGEVSEEQPEAVPTLPTDWQPAQVEAPSSPPPSAPAEEPKQAPPAPRPRQTGMQTLEADPSLSKARSEMERGNIAAALGDYSKLIRKGKFLDEIIYDLREALYRYPVEVPVWQALGDAYMRSNRLQEALDAYNKAEELLR